MRGYANAVPVTWEGVTYRSISECARALGLTPPTIAKRLREGVPLDDPRKKGGAEAVVVEGVKYSSHSEAAKAYHLSSTAFRYRLEHHLPSFAQCVKLILDEPCIEEVHHRIVHDIQRIRNITQELADTSRSLVRCHTRCTQPYQ